MVPTKVPLWFAIQLVQRNLGKVQPPDWLHEDAVNDLWEREDRSREMQLLQIVRYLSPSLPRKYLVLPSFPSSPDTCRPPKPPALYPACCKFHRRSRHSMALDAFTNLVRGFAWVNRPCLRRLCHEPGVRLLLNRHNAGAILLPGDLNPPTSPLPRLLFWARRCLPNPHALSLDHPSPSPPCHPLLTGGCFLSLPGHVRLKLKDIEDLREAKLQTSLRELYDDHPAINISNIGAMEMNKSVASSPKPLSNFVPIPFSVLEPYLWPHPSLHFS